MQVASHVIRALDYLTALHRIVHQSGTLGLRYNRTHIRARVLWMAWQCDVMQLFGVLGSSLQYTEVQCTTQQFMAVQCTAVHYSLLH